MSTKPPMVPDNEPWLLVISNDYATAEEYPSRKAAVEAANAKRSEGSIAPFKIYAPDCCFEIEIVNKISWERFNG